MNFDLVEVSAAFIVKNRKLYTVKRNKKSIDAEKWELPGGKLNPGEKYDEALLRECREELGITVTVIEEVGSVEVDSNSFVLGVIFFLVECDTNSIKLVDHTEGKFVSYSEFLKLDLCYADRVFAEIYKDKILQYID